LTSADNPEVEYEEASAVARIKANHATAGRDGGMIVLVF
jgi:hypothetical protein